MKKVLFCLQTLTRGGVEKELLTILDCFPQEEYEITVLYFYDSDLEVTREFEEKNIKLINLNINTSYYCGSTLHIIKERIRCGKLLEAGRILLFQGLKLGYTGSLQSIRNFPAEDKQYDIAVCYHMHAPTSVRYVVERINAKRKYIWMHNDFSGSGFQPHRISQFLSVYDYIVGCSSQVSNEFCELMPEFANKVLTIQNLVDVNHIRTAAEKIIPEPEYLSRKEWTILTIGRYETQKGIDLAVLACEMLLKKGLSVKWYAIGWGSQEESLKKQVENSEIEENFILLGKRDNPYPYLKHCDVYVQPSRHEGFGLVIAEAKALNKPIVATDFAGAREQLVDHETGTIVPVGDVDRLAAAIEELLLDESLRNKYSQNLEMQTNEEEIKKLLSIF